ncbi:hypothetical protein AMS68_000056 [Peltaster fructicola]|uniref:Uncharacterized protein n=1 Tax=Peltaster fructicola TaxID=286661 RepID=A0A6H0XIS4_9PEZI|nr:hypothetical protein AMS68_000056 [Peltaster fructicola]
MNFALFAPSHSIIVYGAVTGASLAHATLIERIVNSTGPSLHTNPAEDYFLQVCLPMNSTGQPFTDTPCYAYGQSQRECLAKYNQTGVGITSDYTPQQQQSCLCANDYFQGYVGCLDCAKAHNIAGIILPDYAPSAIYSFSSSYCASTNTPTRGIAQAMATALPSYPASYTGASTISDPLSGSTAVSLYFTTTATAATTTTTSGSASGSASGSTSRTSGAAATGAVMDKLAVGGMLGVAAVMFTL